MHRVSRAVFGGLVLAVALLVASGSSASRTSTRAISPSPAYTSQQLDTYAGNDWLNPYGDVRNDRYSTLNQITPANVTSLTQAWHIHLGVCPTGNQLCAGEEESPVVANGIMYIADSKSDVYAFDATNGNLLWTHTPVFDTGFALGAGGRQPGVSVGQGLVFLGERDGKVVAMDQQTGNTVWVASVGPWQKGVRLSTTPVYYNGEVLLGNSGGDGGSISNAFMAFNATNGALLWSWSIIPAHSQPGGNTWPFSGTGSNYGGGAMWENAAVDVKDNSVIFGTGNPVPWNSRGPGADYWTDSLVSLNASTGQLNWAYQTVHHDLWDSDLPNEPIVYDTTVNGKPVTAVISVAKLGWTWAFNAKTGKPIEPVVKVKTPGDTAPDVNPAPAQPIPQTPNTLSGCIAGDPTSYNGANHCYDQPLKNGGGRLCADPGRWQGLTAPDGKPYNVSCHFQPYDTSQYVVAPFESMDWPASSYSPLTKGFITCGVTNRTYGKEQVPAASQVVGSAGGIGSGILSVSDGSIDPLNLNDFGNFSSLDTSTLSPTSGGKFQWHQEWLAPCYSGTVDTASGVTFVGHLGTGTAQQGNGYLAAVNTKTGSELWESPAMDAPAAGPPITYSVNGTQYVAEVVGGEGHNDPTRPNPAVPTQRVRGDSVYVFKLG